MSFIEASDCFRKCQTSTERDSADQPINYHFYKELGLIARLRDIKNNEEYDSLLTMSQQPFQQIYDEECCWLEGYPLSITPIRSKERFSIIEFSLKNGDFVYHAFALSKGINQNYQKLLSAIDEMDSGEDVSGEILMKKCLLHVSFKMKEGKPLYLLHDVSRKRHPEVNES